MPLPELTDSGELPVGVHRASLQETLERSAVGHRQRIAVGERLERIYHLATATAHLARFVVFGSFVTDQPEPNDVDVEYWQAKRGGGQRGIIEIVEETDD